MQQIYIREPEEDILENSNHEEFKERARELEKKLFPSVRCVKNYGYRVYLCVNIFLNLINITVLMYEKE